MRCPSCGFENPAHAKFCGKCGTALSADRKPVPAKSRKGKGVQTPGQTIRPKTRSTPTKPHVAAPKAERRQLTVMFCDLVGSTSLSERLDPEEWREVVRAYQEACAAVIERYEGHIAQYLGDGVLVYFGYPLAHEDDAARAVRAGLEIVEVLQNAENANPRLPSEQHDALGGTAERRLRVGRSFKAGLQVRIGVHTGQVVIGEMGGGSKREQLALGDTPNIAARLQGLAAPDTVVISAATQQLIAGLFTCQNLGQQELKGISTPVPVYSVMGESDIQSRFDAAVQKGLMPLVGRAEELTLLWRHWERTKDGEGQVVLLSGNRALANPDSCGSLKSRSREPE
jgi:class 3 adenylate cyclase